MIGTDPDAGSIMEIGTVYRIELRRDGPLVGREVFEEATFLGEKSIWFPAQHLSSIEARVPVFDVGSDRFVVVQHENILRAEPT
jgi:hypothetical protein